MDDAQLAIEDIKQAMKEYGSNVTIEKSTDEVRDSYGNVITPATTVETNLKALIASRAADENLSKLTKDEKQSYNLSIRFYTTKPINKQDYTVAYNGETYQIVNIFEKVLQNTVLIYEILVKK